MGSEISKSGVFASQAHDFWYCQGHENRSSRIDQGPGKPAPASRPSQRMLKGRWPICLWERGKGGVYYGFNVQRPPWCHRCLIFEPGALLLHGGYSWRSRAFLPQRLPNGRCLSIVMCCRSWRRGACHVTASTRMVGRRACGSIPPQVPLRCLTRAPGRLFRAMPPEVNWSGESIPPMPTR